MSKELMSWKEFEKDLNLTSEQEAEIQFEMDIIEATIQARKENNLSQRDLSKKSGVAQPIIARLERHSNSPQINTLLKILIPLGYTLRVMPIDKNKK